MNTFEKLRESIHRNLGIPESYLNRYGLTLQYEEIDLVEIENDIYGRPQKVARVMAGPWLQMKAQAQKDGVILEVVSAFRSVEKQTDIIKRKTARGERIEEILKECAAPGYSEHHSGRTLDLTTPSCRPLTQAFDKTEAFNWLQENASSYSFRLSYPRGNRYGIAYEPWHWAYAE